MRHHEKPGESCRDLVHWIGAVADEALYMLAVLAAIVVVTITLTACTSPTTEIARRAQRIQEDAAFIVAQAGGIKQQSAESRTLLEEMLADSASLPPAERGVVEQASARQDVIEAKASAIEDRVGQVREDAQTVATNTTKVRDIVPWWAQLLGLGFKAVIAILVVGGVLYITIQLGLWPLLRIGLQRVGLLIPRVVRTAAKLDAEAVAARQASEVQHRTITARRVADAPYRAAYQREQRRIERLRAARLKLGASP